MQQAVRQKKVFFFLKAVEAARECAQRLTDINKSLLWGVKDFTSRIRGNPTQIGAITLTYYCDLWESFPLSDCTWYLWIGQSKSVAREGRNWFCGRCGHVYGCRQPGLVVETRTGAPRRGFVQTFSDANGRG